MANTYSQIYNHFVFAVKNRENIILESWKDELYKYITGIITKQGCKLISIGGAEDHVHLLVGMSTEVSPARIMMEVKRSSTKWINERRFVRGHFLWQEGYGVFSYSRSAINKVASYIENQEIHHKKKSFLEEYLKILRDFDVDYDERYIFRPID